MAACQALLIVVGDTTWVRSVLMGSIPRVLCYWFVCASIAALQNAGRLSAS